MNGSIGHVVGHDSTALALVHDEIECEVLYEEDAVVAEGTTEEGVKHTVASSVGDGAATIGLTTSSEVLGLTSEGSLIDLSFLGSGEGHTVGFELQNGVRGLLSHVMNSVLVTEPVRSLDSVIEVPSPVVFVHVTQGGIDSSLK